MITDLAQHPAFAASAVGASLRARPLGFVDVGARGGIDGVVQPLASLTAVLGFEPDADECQRLRHSLQRGPWAAADVESWALSDRGGTAPLRLLAAATNHSLRPPSLPFTRRYQMVKFDEVGQTVVRTIELDTLLFGERREEWHWGELLKLDTQGTEYEILLGARRTLAERTVAVLTEVSFCQIYEGQKTFSDLDLLLREQGFSFYGFTSIHQRSRKQLNKTVESGRERLLWADAVFLKDPLAGGPAAPLGERGQHVLFASALLLGYYDFALELALATWAKHQPEEAERVRTLVSACAAQAPALAAGEVEKLWREVCASPRHANLAVGRFVDARRLWCDYDDVSGRPE